jgi:tyrosine-protein phosphatase YwqE
MITILKKLFHKEADTPHKQPLLITTDIHSHLLPDLDDGSKSLQESAVLIKQFQNLGYQKLITTPHVMQDFYKNTPEMILEKLEELRIYLKNQYIHIEIEAAAEYYLDEAFIHRLERCEKQLTFGKDYLLFETSFDNQPKQLMETIFLMQAQGYRPVLAHPERYTYLYQQFELIEKIKERGVFLQINLNSLCGYYGKDAQLFAEKLMHLKMIDLVGSDCHHFRHLEALQITKTSKNYHKLADLNLLNHQL